MQAIEVSKKYTQKEWAALFGGGYKATLLIGGKPVAPIHWETIKSSPLVKTEWRIRSTGKLAFKKFVAVDSKNVAPEAKKVLSFVDEIGNVVNEIDIKLVQVNANGSSIEIESFEKTDYIETTLVNKNVMYDFLPDSFVEIWSDDPTGQQNLKALAFDLMQSGKIAAAKKFVKAKGTKAYVAFIYPVATDTTFRLEMMVSENKREAKRWMSIDKVDVEVAVAKPKSKKNEAKVPDLF